MVNNYFKVESGVPIPKQRVGRPPTLPLHAMEVGDSFLLPQRANVRGHNKGGRHYIVRPVEENGEKLFRCWRVC
jgi:hypothetical protein